MNRITASMRRLDDTHGVVRVEDVYDTDIDDLWSALTDPERLARWVATVEGDLRLGGVVQATFTSGWEGPGRIDECDAPHHLRLTMQAGTDEEGELDAVLTADGDRTRLVVEERGLPLGSLPAYGAGWQAHLEDLARYLGGGDSVWMTRWEELRPAYNDLEIA